VDFIYTYKGMLIPIEVKSGTNSKLKSLHLFMDEAPHDVAVRVWSLPLQIDWVTTAPPNLPACKAPGSVGKAPGSVGKAPGSVG